MGRTCFRGQWTHKYEELGFHVEGKWSHCGSLQGLGGGGEDLTSNQVKGPSSSLIFTLLRVLMRWCLLRNPANSFRSFSLDLLGKQKLDFSWDS